MTERERLDRIAQLVLNALAPLQFGVARTPLEIDAVLRMRYECVIELGWAKPEDFPDGRERDEYDGGASFIVCHEGGEIIASARLIPPMPGELLPAEREYGVKVAPPGRPVEVGRVILPQRYRGERSPRILAGVFARSGLIARELGYERTISTASAPLIDLYRGLGFIVSIIAAPKRSWGEERSLIEVSATESGMLPLARAAGVDPLELG